MDHPPSTRGSRCNREILDITALWLTTSEFYHAPGLLVVLLLTLTGGLHPSLAIAAEPEYDLVIRNGRIVDGTGNPWFYGDVAITGDKIVAVGRVPAGKARREIDAKGLVVAPGFIDMHSHSDDLLLEDGHAQSKIRQGVTTEVLGEGTRPGRFKGKLSARKFEARGRGVHLGHARRLSSTPSRRPASRQRRQLCRPRQRLAMRDGQVVRPADARSSSTR